MAKLWRVALLVSALLTPAAYAQQPPQAPKQPQGMVKPVPKKVPEQKQKTLDELFELLKVAPDLQSAKYVESLIMQKWFTAFPEGQRETVGMLMVRAKMTYEVGRIDDTIKLLSSVIEIAPDYFEARSLRARIYFEKENFAGAMEDLANVLSHEPRHFQALMGLGTILQAVGREKAALEVFRRIQKIYPHMENIEKLIKKLEVPVEGRDI